jgi:phenylacetate-CoA ligase
MDRLGLRPEALRTADDLSKLPLIARDQIQREPEYFVSTQQPVHKYRKLRSSGSTGSPLTVYWDLPGWFKSVAQGERHRAVITARTGRFFGYRESFIAAPQSTLAEEEAFVRTTAFFPSRLRVDRQLLSLYDPPQENVDRINDFRPDVVFTYGSYAEALFKCVDESRRSFHRPKVVVYTGDGVNASTKHRVLQKLGVPIVGVYECIEAPAIGFECGHGTGLHLNIDLYPVRILRPDGSTAADGGPGEVVISNLVNRASVLLNYRVGDIAAWTAEPCPCGRSLPLLQDVEGRTDDWLQLPGGSQIHPQAVCQVFRGIVDLWDFQIAQQADDRFEVAVVGSEACDRKTLSERLTARLAKAVGDQATIEVRFVESIPLTPGGKRRAVVRSWAAP